MSCTWQYLIPSGFGETGVQTHPVPFVAFDLIFAVLFVWAYLQIKPAAPAGR